MINLIEANEKYLEGYKEAYIETKKKIEEGHLKKHNMLFINPEEVDIIQHYKDNRDVSKLPKQYVPSYDYFFVEEDKFIGIVHIRIRLTENLLRYGGHIGYAINPKYWNQGYGTKLLQAAINNYKNIIEEDKILITSDDDNIASCKIIEANGGVLENIIENKDCEETFLTRRYWIKKEEKK